MIQRKCLTSIKLVVLLVLTASIYLCIRNLLMHVSILEPVPSVPRLDPKFKDYGEKGCQGNPLRDLFVGILSEWIKLAAQENITYFLYCGSLLGQARDEEMIPYDHDVDVVVEVKEFSKLQKMSEPRGFSISDGKLHLIVQPEYLLKKNMDERTKYSCEGKVVPREMDMCSFAEPMGRIIKNSRFLDFFAFVDKGDSVIIPYGYQTINFKKEDIYPIQECKFIGIKTHCPRNIPVALEGYFGKNLAPSKKCRNGKWVSS